VVVIVTAWLAAGPVAGASVVDQPRATQGTFDSEGPTLARPTPTPTAPALFDGQDLRGVDFGSAALGARTFRGADLTDAIFRDASIPRSDLTQANLTRADLSGADLYGIVATGATFVDADLRRASLQDGMLEGADLRGADLREADLSHARLASAVLAGADLRGAYLDDAVLTAADLTDATLAGAHLVAADLGGANLGGATLEAADLSDTTVTGASLAGTDLRGARLVGAVGLTDAMLAEAFAVSERDLPAALYAARTRLEDRTTIHATLRPVCTEGTAIPQARPYRRGRGIHPIVAISPDDAAQAGPASPSTLEWPEEWEPLAVRHAELVACIRPREVRSASCGRYRSEATGAEIVLHRRWYAWDVSMVGAAEANVIERRTFKPDDPIACPERAYNDPIGTPRVEAVQRFIRRLAGGSRGR
jgi:uncharacterized protein YjbI with pentapeptide repeats